MIRFNNDYNHGAHNAIIQAIGEINTESYAGYGEDEWCQKGADEIRKYLGGADVDIHFMVGGTPANITVMTAALRPYESVICAENGHINHHEAGSIEHTGHKILSVPAKEGKLTAEAVRETAAHYYDHGQVEFLTAPKIVFLSSPSEYGTIYSKKELLEIRKVCDQYNMYLYVDGARLGYGMAAPTNDVTLKDLAELSDIFYIGGTKVGALFGEAVVIANPAYRQDFRYIIKQRGGMLAKGRLLGIQFETLFTDGLYFEISKHAVDLAMKIRKACEEKGFAIQYESYTNQQFPILPNELVVELRKKYAFYTWQKVDEDHTSVRFCTSWAADAENVEQLLADIRAFGA